MNYARARSKAHSTPHTMHTMHSALCVPHSMHAELSPPHRAHTLYRWTSPCNARPIPRNPHPVPHAQYLVPHAPHLVPNAPHPIPHAIGVREQKFALLPLGIPSPMAIQVRRKYHQSKGLSFKNASEGIIESQGALTGYTEHLRALGSL